MYCTDSKNKVTEYANLLSTSNPSTNISLMTGTELLITVATLRSISWQRRGHSGEPG